MRDPLERIFMLLASARVSAQELDRFIRLARDDARSVFDYYQRALRKIEGIEGDRIAQRIHADADLYFDSTLRDVNFIIQNARLPRGHAARQIAKQLVSMGAAPNERSVRFTAKDGFENWLEKIIKMVGSSALLRATTIVADRYVKKPRSDWPLTSS